MKEHLARLGAAFILPFAASFGCSESNHPNITSGQAKILNCTPEATSSSDFLPIPKIPELPVTEEDIINARIENKAKGLGTVVVEIRQYHPTIKAVFELFEFKSLPCNQPPFDFIPLESRLVTSASALQPGDPINVLFTVPSCEKKYTVLFSVDDEKQSKSFPFRDPVTGQTISYFSLPKDTCYYPIPLYIK